MSHPEPYDLSQLVPLSADKPTDDPERDRLEYAPFAQQLARSITRMAPAEGLVMALYGEWGSGKSTVLGFVERYLQAAPPSQQPVVVHFNPWWFAGTAELTEKFFSQLDLALGRKKSLDKLRSGIADLATTVSKAKGVIPYAGAGEAVASLVKPPQKDVPHLKKEIGDFLLEKNIRLLIIVDDIDRLNSADEIRQVFRLVKAVADFPNSVYLLAFDKDIVVKALEQAPAVPGSGEAFLEKIVQVPFELPLPDKPALRLFFFEKLDRILAGTPDALFSEENWANVFHAGIDHFLETPRDVIRLINALQVSYPAVQGEVNAVDFVALETLRVSLPEVYDVIRRNPQMFAGHTERSSLYSSSDDLKEFHEDWIKKVVAADRAFVKALVTRLFPKVSKVWNNSGYGAEWETQWRRDLRACSISIYPVYFRLSLPTGTISRQELLKVLELAEDSDALSKHLLELASVPKPINAPVTKIRAVLERIEDFTEKDIPVENIKPILTAFFNVGDQIAEAEPERVGMFSFGINIQFGRLVFQLVSRLSQLERYELLTDIFTAGEAVELIVHEISVFSQEHGKLGGTILENEKGRFVSSAHLTALEQIGLARIEQLANSGSLLAAKTMLSMLYRWKEWGDETKPKAWVEEIAQDDASLLTFLEKGLGTSHQQALGDAAVTRQVTLDPAVFDPFLNANDVTDRVRTILDRDDLTERHQLAARLFVQEQNRRQQGVPSPGSTD